MKTVYVILMTLLAATESACTVGRLTVCVNSNICGRRNPTYTPGYGYARRAIECMRVIGPPWLELRPGTCFIRCSRGVNAKLEGCSTAAEAAGVPTIRSRDLFRLNSIDDCAKMLEDELEWLCDPALVTAYRKYEAALVLLDDVFASIQGVSKESRANEALPMLDEAASYVLETSPDALDKFLDTPPAATFARAAAANAASRIDWNGSRWRESFYKTEMAFAARMAEADDAGAGAGRAGVEVRASYGKTVLEWPEGVRQLGAVQGEATGRLFRGTWREESADSGSGGGGGGGGATSGSSGSVTRVSRSAVMGTVQLEMAADGLSFEGEARSGDKVWRWEGERIPDPMRARAPGSERERWGARVLVERSRARLRLGQSAEALRDAVCALGLCALPEAWEAIATAALEVGDKRTATIALSEHWYSTGSAAASSMPTALANRRREQLLALESMPGGGGIGIIAASAREGRQGAGAATASGPVANVRSEGGGRPLANEEDVALATAMRAIFVEGYVLPRDDEE